MERTAQGKAELRSTKSTVGTYYLDSEPCLHLHHGTTLGFHRLSQVALLPQVAVTGATTSIASGGSPQFGRMPGIEKALPKF